jgi:hypothetical protein
MTLQLTTIEDDDDGRTAGLSSTVTLTAVDDDSRHAAIRDVLRLLEANQRLRVALEVNAERCESALLRLLDGTEPGHVLDDQDVAGGRIELADSMSRFERARHAARGTLMAAQFGAGMNMKEIGHRWGISRQLVHRFLKEMQNGD